MEPRSNSSTVRASAFTLALLAATGCGVHRRITFDPPPSASGVDQDPRVNCKGSAVSLEAAGDDPYYRLTVTYRPAAGSSCAPGGGPYVNKSTSAAVTFPTGSAPPPPSAPCGTAGVPVWAFLSERGKCWNTGDRFPSASTWVSYQNLSSGDVYVWPCTAEKTTLELDQLSKDLTDASAALGTVYAPATAAGATIGTLVAAARKPLQSLINQMATFDVAPGGSNFENPLRNRRTGGFKVRSISIPLKESLNGAPLREFGVVEIGAEACPSLLLQGASDVFHPSAKELLSVTVFGSGTDLGQSTNSSLAIWKSLDSPESVYQSCRALHETLESRGLNALDRAVMLHKLVNETAWCEAQPQNRGRVKSCLDDQELRLLRNVHLGFPCETGGRLVERANYAVNQALNELIAPGATNAQRQSTIEYRLGDVTTQQEAERIASYLLTLGLTGNPQARMCGGRRSDDQAIVVAYSTGDGNSQGSLVFDVGARDVHLRDPMSLSYAQQELRLLHPTQQFGGKACEELLAPPPA